MRPRSLRFVIQYKGSVDVAPRVLPGTFSIIVTPFACAEDILSVHLVGSGR